MYGSSLSAGCFLRFLFVPRKGVYTISSKDLLINYEIHEKEVRVIGAEGEQLGIMSSADALAKAEESDLDLVLIAPQGNPP